MLAVENIAENLRALREQMHAHSCVPNPTLIAVAKTFAADAVRAAHIAGVTDIGENYLQEAEEKIRACADLPLVWHFIGRLQKNKLSRVAQQFDWVHSVDRLSFAERLAAARAATQRPPLNVFVQVNISGEASKGGAAVADTAALLQGIAALPSLRLRGLMILPAQEGDAAQQAAVFRRTAALQQELRAQTGIALDCLSMGMSADYPHALRAGATHIRIGSAVFGQRTYTRSTTPMKKEQ